MFREGLGKLDVVDKAACTCDPSRKAEGDHKFKGNLGEYHKMKQKPAFKKTWCVQGATENKTFVDRRLEREPRRAERCLRAVGGG